MRDGKQIRFAHPGKVGGFALREGDTAILASMRLFGPRLPAPATE